ncbi:Response regulator PleD [Caulifigura coniformis]|uniref:diguanylate cyclase n=1 Tax=Caulifigura coniformis TaxID=2527983 RepID=A0A517SFA9_9PLAN|nr:diguanylate cyclase [Caulifigura coniformis]QDT54811.1 Response regulator PleD [Caulifigura coniformis]
MQVLIAGDPGGKWLPWLCEWGYDPVVTRSADEAVGKLMASTGPLIALLMPGLSTVDAGAVCRQVRSEAGLRYVFVIRSDDDSRPQTIAELLEAGADQVLPATVSPLELEQRIAVGRRIAQLQQRFAEASEMLHVMATTDALTGLRNRSEILRVLDRELNRMHRHGYTLSVLMIDVDHFKKINDQYGHPAGDEVLRRIGNVLQTAMRSYDEIGRYGGEEFIAILPETTLHQAISAAERIRACVEQAEVRYNGLRFDLSISVGAVSSFGKEDTPGGLIERADMALYAAKQAGRNCVCGFPNELPARPEAAFVMDAGHA